MRVKRDYSHVLHVFFDSHDIDLLETVRTDEALANGKAAHHFHTDHPSNVNASCTKETAGCLGRKSGQKMVDPPTQSQGYKAMCDYSGGGKSWMKMVAQARKDKDLVDLQGFINQEKHKDQSEKVLVSC